MQVRLDEDEDLNIVYSILIFIVWNKSAPQPGQKMIYDNDLSCKLNLHADLPFHYDHLYWLRLWWKVF